MGSDLRVWDLRVLGQNTWVKLGEVQVLALVVGPLRRCVQPARVRGTREVSAARKSAATPPRELEACRRSPVFNVEVLVQVKEEDAARAGRRSFGGAAREQGGERLQRRHVDELAVRLAVVPLRLLAC